MGGGGGVCRLPIIDEYSLAVLVVVKYCNTTRLYDVYTCSARIQIHIK